MKRQSALVRQRPVGNARAGHHAHGQVGPFAARGIGKGVGRFGQFIGAQRGQKLADGGLATGWPAPTIG